MLNDILQSIEQKARQEIEKIEQAREQALQVIAEEFAEKTKQSREQNKKALLEQSEKEVLEFQKVFELKDRFAAQQAKIDIINEVYQRALSEIGAFNEQSFGKVVLALTDLLPEHFQGQLIAGKKTGLALKAIAKTKHLNVSDSLLEEGFIAVSPQMEIDCRISQILEQNKEKIDPELLKILFQ